MQIPFTAYAEDCTVSGEVDLRADRLSDLLATTEEFEVDRAAFRALDDGHVVEAASVDLSRDDLCVVLATGPRGREDRRLWTRQHAVRVRVGPYVVIGHLHAPPTIDPFQATHRPIVALTACAVGYAQAGASIWVEAEAVLINTTKIVTIEAASEEDLRLARQLERATPVDVRPQDVSPAH
jgi:hypothetical protein